MAAALAAAGAGLRCQEPLLAAEPELTAATRVLLHGPDPVLRGEAALAIAPLQEPRDFDDLLAIAKDPAPEARVRGLLALGTYGKSGVDVTLLDALRDRERSDRERAVAAYALGMLSDTLRGGAYDELIRGRIGSGTKRERMALLAFLEALCRGGVSSRPTLLSDLLLDDSNHDPHVQRLALRALAATPQGLGTKESERALAARDAEVREEAARLLGERSPTEACEQRIEAMASGDPVPSVRAAALESLVRWRRPKALDIAIKALASNDAAEAAAGARGCLRLAAGVARDTVEAAIVRSQKQDVLERLLQSWTGAASADLRTFCVTVARDPRRPLGVRIAAAELLVDAHDLRARPLLLDVLFDSRDLQTMTRCVQDLVELRAADELPARIAAAKDTGGRSMVPMRAAALLRARSPGSLELAKTLVTDAHLAREDRALLLHSLWLGSRVPGESVCGELLGPLLAGFLR